MRFDSVFGCGALLEVDCLVPLENVGNESENLSVCVVLMGCVEKKLKQANVSKAENANMLGFPATCRRRFSTGT